MWRCLEAISLVFACLLVSSCTEAPSKHDLKLEQDLARLSSQVSMLSKQFDATRSDLKVYFSDIQDDLKRRDMSPAVDQLKADTVRLAKQVEDLSVAMTGALSVRETDPPPDQRLSTRELIIGEWTATDREQLITDITFSLTGNDVMIYRRRLPSGEVRSESNGFVHRVVGKTLEYKSNIALPNDYGSFNAEILEVDEKHLRLRFAKAFLYQQPSPGEVEFVRHVPK